MAISKLIFQLSCAANLCYVGPSRYQSWQQRSDSHRQGTQLHIETLSRITSKSAPEIHKCPHISHTVAAHPWKVEQRKMTADCVSVAGINQMILHKTVLRTEIFFLFSLQLSEQQEANLPRSTSFNLSKYIRRNTRRLVLLLGTHRGSPCVWAAVGMQTGILRAVG